ncbi:MAG: glycosyltransferase [Pirellulales bacterium]
MTFAYPPSSAVGAFRAARFAKFLPDFGWTPFVVTAESEMSTVERDDSRMDWTDRSATVVRTRPWALPRAWKRRLLATEGLSSPTETPAVGVAKNTAERPTFRGGCRATARRLARAVASPFCIPDKHVWWAVPALTAMRRIVRESRPRVLLSSSPPHSSHLIALALKAWTGIPVVIDLRDPWNHRWGASENGRLKQSILDRLERLCFARADRIILNTPELLAEVQERVPPQWREKFAVIPNGYDPQVRESIEALVQAADARPLDAPLRLCHAGSVYGRRDIRPLIEAVALLNRQGRRVEFEQVGYLANPADVAACVAKNDAGQFVRLLGRRPHDEALRRLTEADVLIVVRQNTALQAPAKLYELMLFGKPILALDDEGATTRLVRDYQLGVVADPVDPAAIAAGIVQAEKQISATPSEGRAAALRDFDAREQTRQLANVLASAVESKRRAGR